MKEINKLAKHIECEIRDAKNYAEEALACKAEFPDVAKVYIELAGEEMDHAMKLHAAVVSEIERYRKTNGDPPERMLGRYDYMHERYIDLAAEAKALIAMYEEK